MRRELYYLFISVLFQSFAVLFGKYAANSIVHFSLFSLLTNSFYIFSIISLAIQSIFWNKTLKYMPLSVAYPFTGISYFFIVFYSGFIFKETIRINNYLGVCIIMIGLYFLGKVRTSGSRNEEKYD